MLTAIGAGTQILHLIPKEEKSLHRAKQIFKGLLVRLMPYILMLCVVFYLAVGLVLGF